VDAIVETSVRLRRVLRGAFVVQEELIEPSHSLHGFVWQQLPRNGQGREAHLCGSDLSVAAAKSQ